MKYIFYFFAILFLGLFVLLLQVEDTILKKYEYQDIERKFDNFLIKAVLKGEEVKINNLYSEIRNPYFLHINVSKQSNDTNKLIAIKKISLTDTRNKNNLNLLVDKTLMKFKRDEYNLKFDIFLIYRKIVLDFYNPQKLKVEFYFVDNPSKLYMYEGIFEKNYKEEAISVWDILLFST